MRTADISFHTDSGFMPVWLRKYSLSYSSFSDVFQNGLHIERDGSKRIMFIFLYLPKSTTLCFYCEYTQKIDT